MLLVFLLLSGFIQPLFQKFFQQSSIYSYMFVGFGLFLFAVLWIVLSSLLLCFFHQYKVISFFKIFFIQIVLLCFLTLSYWIVLKNRHMQSLDLIKNDQQVSQKKQQLPLLDPDRPLTILNMVERNFNGIRLEANKPYTINVRLAANLKGQNLVGKIHAFVNGKTGQKEIFRFSFTPVVNADGSNVWTGQINLDNVSLFGTQGILEIEEQEFKIQETVSVFFMN